MTRMRNSNYEHEGMIITLNQKADAARQLVNRLGWVTNQLKAERGGGYHTDHLDETLSTVIKQLQTLSASLEQVREYTLYPSVSVQVRMNERGEERRKRFEELRALDEEMGVTE